MCLMLNAGGQTSAVFAICLLLYPGEVFYCLCVVKVFYVVRGPGVNANRAVWGSYSPVSSSSVALPS